MKLLNVGCGGLRPQDEHWWNLDELRKYLKVGTPERTNLDAEPRYIECDLLHESIPFKDEFFDGMLLNHVLEHFECFDAVKVLRSCRRVLKPGGVLVASVPNVTYFRDVHDLDTKENAVNIFGEPIHDQSQNFFEYALFGHTIGHKMILNEDGLWALLRKSGFDDLLIVSSPSALIPLEIQGEIERHLNRHKFSTILWAIK